MFGLSKKEEEMVVVVVEPTVPSERVLSAGVKVEVTITTASIRLLVFTRCEL